MDKTTPEFLLRRMSLYRRLMALVRAPRPEPEILPFVIDPASQKTRFVVELPLSTP